MVDAAFREILADYPESLRGSSGQVSSGWT
jgi:hypothetical protein